MRWCWVNFQCRGVLLIWIKVGQGPTALAVGAGGVVWTFFSLIYLFSFLFPSLWETARYRLKYCLEGLLSPKQPTKFHSFSLSGWILLMTGRMLDRGQPFGSYIYWKNLFLIIFYFIIQDLFFNARFHTQYDLKTSGAIKIQIHYFS